MATTRITDVVVPEIFTPYVIEKAQELSAIFRSGLAVPNAKLNDLISGGGKTINIPAFKDLTGNSEVLSDDPEAPLTPAKITTKKDVAPVLYRGKAWQSSELAGALAGANPIDAIAQLVAEFWVRDEQATLLAVLKGCFGATNMADLVAGGTTTYYDGDVIIDAQGKLGDASGKLTAIAMHSAVRNDLLKKDKTAFETYRDGKVQYDKYLGYDVIVDDTCPYDSSTQTYASYLFARGAVSLGIGSPVALTQTETDRDSLAGQDILINRRAYVMHLNGMQFTSNSVQGATPNNTELGTASNWTRVSDLKNMGVVKLVGKLGRAS